MLFVKRLLSLQLVETSATKFNFLAKLFSLPSVRIKTILGSGAMRFQKHQVMLKEIMLLK
jgi:hypothetical protein